MPRPAATEPRLELYRDKWAVNYTEAGQRRRISTGSADRQGAEQFLADFRAKAASHPQKLTLSDALDAYIKDRTPNVVSVNRMLEAVVPLRRAMGALRVDQITKAQWARYAAARVTLPPARSKDKSTHRPQPVANGTLRREYNVLRAALALAKANGLLPQEINIKPPADSTPRDRYLTKDEARALLAACVAPHLRAFVAVAVYTGARKGSILSLTWDQVDWTNNMVDFNEPGRVVTAKRRAIVPMTPALRAELETAYAQRNGNFVVQINGRALPFGVRHSFGRLCKRAGLQWCPTPHHIKHSVASWFAEARVPVDQAADWLATDPKTLRRTYRKFDPAYLRDVGGALDL